MVLVSVITMVLVGLLIWRCRKQRQEQRERKLPDHPYQRLLSVMSMSAGGAGDVEDPSGGVKSKKKGQVLAEAVGQALVEMRQVSPQGAPLLHEQLAPQSPES